MRDSRQHGFTLLELMIVVAIISALVALSVPSVARSRTQAREAQVIGFLRQYHIAQIQFQAAGIKDSNNDSIGDFGTLQDLLNATIYAQSTGRSGAVTSRPALASANTYLRAFFLPAAFADSKPASAPKPEKEKEKVPKESTENRGKPENDHNDNESADEHDNDDNGKPGSGEDHNDNDHNGGADNDHQSGKPGSGEHGDNEQDNDHNGKPGSGEDQDDNDRPDDSAGDRPEDIPGGGEGQEGNNENGGGQGNQGGGGPSGGAAATGPAFLQGVSSSLLESGILYGYRFQFTTVVQSDQGPGWYEVTCKPANPRNGGRGFYIDASGVIRQTPDGTFPHAASKQL